MTVLKRVSQKEMKRRTGFGKALGYTFPEKDEILIRKDLPKKAEKEVIAHEEEHLEKGEEGPFLDFLGSLFGASKQAKSADKATKAQEKAFADQLQFARESRDYAQGVQAPYVKAGATALDALMSMTGLGGGAAAPVRQRPRGPLFRRNPDLDIAGGSPRMNARGSSFNRRYALRYAGGPLEQNQMYNINEFAPEDVYSGGAVTRNPNPMTIDGRTGYVEGRAYGGYMNEGGVLGGAYKPTPPWGGSPPKNVPRGSYPRENPGGVEGGYNFMTDPGYQFRFEEGQRALDRGAAARGGLLSGGYGRKAIRYGQGFASNEYTNVYNRIANIAGLGQVAGGQAGQSALYGAGMMGNAAGNAGFARASGYAAQGDIWGNAISSTGDFLQDIWNNRQRSAGQGATAGSHGIPLGTNVFRR